MSTSQAHSTICLVPASIPLNDRGRDATAQTRFTYPQSLQQGRAVYQPLAHLFRVSPARSKSRYSSASVCSSTAFRTKPTLQLSRLTTSTRPVCRKCCLDPDTPGRIKPCCLAAMLPTAVVAVKRRLFGLGYSAVWTGWVSTTTHRIPCPLYPYTVSAVNPTRDIRSGSLLLWSV